MSNFEKITASPEALAEFLAKLPVADSPWDASFHERFCGSCERADCDVDGCPHYEERYSPLWWLKLGEKPGEVEGLTIRIRAAFPIEWDREYYTIEETKKEMRAPCPCCDDTGKVTIKGDEYTCPRCGGDWRKKKVIGTTSVYYVGKWELEKVEAKRFTGPTKTKIVLTFRQKNSRENYNKSLEVQDHNFHNTGRIGQERAELLLLPAEPGGRIR